MMKKLFLTGLLTFLMTGLGPGARSQDRSPHPLEELFDSEVVYAQEKGEFQLTLTSRFNRRRPRELVNHLSVEYGITDAWQSEIEWDALAQRRTVEGWRVRGSGDLQLGTKYSFMNIGGSNFHGAVGFELGLPSGSTASGLSEGAVEYEPYVVFARDFPGHHRLQLFTQGGMEISQPIRAGGEQEPGGVAFTWRAGLLVPVKAICFTGEFGLRGGKGGDARQGYLTPGAVWRMSRNWEFGVGAQFGVGSTADAPGVVVKLTREF